MPSAREAVEALIFAYAERLDAGDLAGVGQLFEHACYGSGGAATLSGAEVAKLLEEIVIRYEDGTMTINDFCPVLQRPLGPVKSPIFVNGRPVGFC